MTKLEDWFEGSPPQRVSLQVEHRDVPDSGALRRALTEVGGKGWICGVSEVMFFDGARWPDCEILAAEVALEGGKTLLVRRHGTGWRLWTQSDTEAGDDLAFDETYLSTEADRFMRYRIYYRLTDSSMDGIRAYRPHAARFLGWEE